MPTRSVTAWQLLLAAATMTSGCWATSSAHAPTLADPTCIILTGENIAREDFMRLVQPEADSA
jgi:hypothetical protein